MFECWIYQYGVSWSLNVDFDRVWLYTRDHIIIQRLVDYEGAEEVKRKRLWLGFIGRHDWRRNGQRRGKDWMSRKSKEHSGEGAIDWEESDD